MPTDRDGNGNRIKPNVGTHGVPNLPVAPQSQSSREAQLRAIAANNARYTGQAAVWAKGGQTGLWGEGVGLANAAANQALGPSYQDPYNNVDGLSALLSQITGASSGGSGGSRGSGGGGGSSAAAAAAKAHALEMNLWHQIEANQHLGETATANLDASYVPQFAALDQQDQANSSALDAYGANVNQLHTGAAAQYAQMLQELQGQANTTRGTAAGIYSQGDQALQGIGQQYDAIAADRANGANKTLSAFGAAPISASNGVDNYVTAARTNNQQNATSADSLYGTRSNVYAGLGADANQANDAKFNTLMSQLATQRLQASASSASQHAALTAAQANAKNALLLQIAQQKAALEGQLTGA